MRKIATIIIMVLLCLTTKAQSSAFVDIDWDLLSNDSILPYYVYQTQLGEGEDDDNISFDIEYPQLEALNSTQIDKWNLRTMDIGSWPEFDQSVGVSAKIASLEVGFIPIIFRNDKYWAITSFRPSIKTVFRVQNNSTGDIKDRYSKESVLSKGKWVKIRVSSSGVFKLTDRSLKSMGFSDPSKVRLYGRGGTILSTIYLQNIADDLSEIPLYRGSDYMLFYAHGPISWSMNYNGTFDHTVNTYSKWGYYFLTDRDAEQEPLRIINEEPSTITNNRYFETYPDYALYEKDAYSWYRSGSRFFDDYDYANGNSQNYKFNLEGITNDSVRLTVAFSAAGNTSSTLSVKVNGTKVSDLYLSAMSDLESATITETSFVCKNQFSETNTVNLTHNRTDGISGRLDFIRLNFRRKLALRGSYTQFRTGVNGTYCGFKISNTTDTVMVWRVNNNDFVSILPSTFSQGITVTNTSYCKSTDEFVAVNPLGTFSEPELVGPVENQNLHGLDSIDMVIIIPASGKMITQAERLAESHRKMDSLKVVIVNAEEVYNEFSSGTPDATAYRRFMKMLYDRADINNIPKYLLLLGDGAWDNRMITNDWAGQNPDDYLLCYESYISTNHVTSYVMEDYFGLLDDNEGINLKKDQVDIGVGRLPFTEADDAKVMVDKIISYMNGESSGSWKNRILFWGDDGDNNSHMKDADSVASMISNKYPSLFIKKVYWDAYKMEVSASGNSYPSVSKLLLEQLKDGSLIVNYTGHGSPDVLSHELVLSKSDLSSFVSKNLSFWITASCDIAPFDGTVSNLGESLISNKDGGVIGMLSTTRTVYSSQNLKMNILFSDYVLAKNENGIRNSVGDALRLTKTKLVSTSSAYKDDSENKLHYVLLGDPALKLNYAEYDVVVDSFDHKAADSKNLYAKAGSVISVSGHIENNGMKLSDYYGPIYSTSFDNERTITTLNNSQEADNPFTYRDRDKILFSGIDSVRSGMFSFLMPIPLDINYSDERGKLLLFAESNQGRGYAHGNYVNYLVGGTIENLSVDSVGPTIKAYLNTPDFAYGSTVNNSPLLVVDLQDSVGLNTSGNGLGHNIMLVIDNSAEFTYVLNDYFTFESGDYTRGRVVFNIPELPEGSHTLMIRAWDLMNNSTTRYLEFKVDNSKKPAVSVRMTDNPAVTNTTFVVNHDCPGVNALVTIQVYDSNGSSQWIGTQVDTSNEGVSYMNWNLSGSNGSKLKNGVYLIRATVSADESNSSVSEKLIIL